MKMKRTCGLLALTLAVVCGTAGASVVRIEFDMRLNHLSQIDFEGSQRLTAAIGLTAAQAQNIASTPLTGTGWIEYDTAGAVAQLATGITYWDKPLTSMGVTLGGYTLRLDRSATYNTGGTEGRVMLDDGGAYPPQGLDQLGTSVTSAPAPNAAPAGTPYVMAPQAAAIANRYVAMNAFSLLLAGPGMLASEDLFNPGLDPTPLDGTQSTISFKWIYSTSASTMEQGPNGVGGGNGVLSGLVTAARLVNTGTPPQGELPEPASLALAGLALAAAAASAAATRRRAWQWLWREG